MSPLVTRESLSDIRREEGIEPVEPGSRDDNDTSSKRERRNHNLQITGLDVPIEFKLQDPLVVKEAEVAKRDLARANAIEAQAESDIIAFHAIEKAKNMLEWSFTD